MSNPTFVRKAGLIGMAGAALALASIGVEFGLGIAGPENGAPWLVHEALFYIGAIGMMIAFLGLIWGGAFRSRLGAFGVGAHVLAYTLILLAGVLTAGSEDSPIFLIFPIAGLLITIGAVLIGIATVTGGRWQGWQRWAPLAYSLVQILAIDLPMMMGSTTDGPGVLGESLQAAAWFLVALAVYSTQSEPAALPGGAAHQA